MDGANAPFRRASGRRRRMQNLPKRPVRPWHVLRPARAPPATLVAPRRAAAVPRTPRDGAIPPCAQRSVQRRRHRLLPRCKTGLGGSAGAGLRGHDANGAQKRSPVRGSRGCCAGRAGRIPASSSPAAAGPGHRRDPGPQLPARREGCPRERGQTRSLGGDRDKIQPEHKESLVCPAKQGPREGNGRTHPLLTSLGSHMLPQPSLRSPFPNPGTAGSIWALQLSPRLTGVSWEQKDFVLG